MKNRNNWPTVGEFHFVDAMISNNNADLEREVNQLNQKIDILTDEIKQLKGSAK